MIMEPCLTQGKLMQQLLQTQKCMTADTDFAPLVTVPLELKLNQLRIIFGQDKVVRQVHGKLDAQVVGAWRAAGGGAGGGVDTMGKKGKEIEEAQVG